MNLIVKKFLDIVGVVALSFLVLFFVYTIVNIIW